MVFGHSALPKYRTGAGWVALAFVEWDGAAWLVMQRKQIFKLPTLANMICMENNLKMLQ